jgi:hypothetical protein
VLVCLSICSSALAAPEGPWEAHPNVAIRRTLSRGALVDQHPVAVQPGHNPIQELRLGRGIRGYFKRADANPGVHANLRPEMVYRNDITTSRMWDALTANNPEVIAFGFVAPTEERVHEGHLGSNQLFIEGAKHSTVEAAAAGSRYHRPAAEIARAFAFLVGSSDSHGENVMAKSVQDPQRQAPIVLPKAIDNGLTFPEGTMGQFLWPSAWVEGQTGPLLGSTIRFIRGIDERLVVDVLARSGLSSRAAIYTLRRLARMKRDPSFLEIGADGAEAMVRRVAEAGASRKQGLLEAEEDAINQLVFSVFRGHGREP